MEKVNNIEIVKTNLSHLDAIDKIQKEHPHNILSTLAIQNDLKSNNYYYISALNNGNLIGFTGISILTDHVDILAIVVDKEFTKQGIATLMLNHIISFCNNNKFNKIFLEVREDNYSAIKLYKKFDFKKITIRKNYYKDNNSNALIYMKEL